VSEEDSNKTADNIDSDYTKSSSSNELVSFFTEQCEKAGLDTTIYMDAFLKRVKKRNITVVEDVIVYVQGLKRKEEDIDKPKKSQADRLVEYGLRADLFYDQHGAKYAKVFLPLIDNDTNDTNDSPHHLCVQEKVEKSVSTSTGNMRDIVNTVDTVSGKRRVVMPMRSGEFREWLAGEMYCNEGKTPNPTTVRAAISVLSNIAKRRGVRCMLYNRVAPDPNGDGFWIDMCDENWRAIHVTDKGWEIADDPPTLFRRYKHQEPLAVPVKVSEMEQIKTVFNFLNFVNMPKNELDDGARKDRVLFMCTILSYFVPTLPHPILVLFGSQGSAKTWLFRFVKRLIDPSKAETLSLTSNENEVIQQLDHNYLTFYDNVSYIQKWLSDLLCRAQSGMGYSKRQLYTDDDDVIYNLMRCIGLNGINIVASSGDLLDRSLMFGLEPIADEQRCTELELVTKFEKARPFILGAVLSILSKSLKYYSTVPHDPLRRLADFHRWGCAIANALGYTIEEFNAAYSVKIEMQDEEALNASLTATALIGYCLETVDKLGTKNEDFKCEKDEDGHIIIRVTPTKLYDEVTTYAKGKGMKTSKRYWAASANSFMRKVNDVKPNLSRAGCEIMSEHDGTKRWVIIDATELIYKKGHKPSDIFTKIEDERKKQYSKNISSLEETLNT